MHGDVCYHVKKIYKIFDLDNSDSVDVLVYNSSNIKFLCFTCVDFQVFYFYFYWNAHVLTPMFSIPLSLREQTSERLLELSVCSLEASCYQS